MDNVQGALFGLGAAAAFGIADLGAAIAGRRVGGVRTTGVVVPVSGLVIIALFLLSGSVLPSDPLWIAAAVASGVGAGVVYFAFYAALTIGPISIVNPILSSSGGATVLFSILFLGERPAPSNLLAAGLATLGVVLAGVVFQRGKRIRLVGRGVLFAIIATLAVSGLSIVSSVIIRQIGPLQALALSRASTMVVVGAVLLALHQGRRSATAAPSPGIKRPAADGSLPIRAAGARIVALLLVIGVLEVLAIGSFYFGLARGETWIVGLTSSFGPLVGIAGGVLLFGERPRQIQWLGVVLVLASTVLLAAP